MHRLTDRFLVIAELSVYLHVFDLGWFLLCCRHACLFLKRGANQSSIDEHGEVSSNTRLYHMVVPICAL